MQPLGPYASTMVLADYAELNGFNLASHTTALEQSVLGKPQLSVNGLVLVNPTICGKRSRSNSDASSYSSSAGSSHDAASVFSSENDGSEAGFDSQTSIGELTPSSRKSSMGDGIPQQLDNLATWRAELLAASQSERERCAKRIRHLEGEVARLASEVMQTASQPQPAAAPAAAVMASGADVSPASSTSSTSTEGAKNALVDCLVDSACRTLDNIWNASNPSASCELAKKGGLSLQLFVRETLRRGRSSCSTLQAALLYCVRLGEAAQKSQQHSLRESSRAAGVEIRIETDASSPFVGMTKEELCMIRCPRRMFLASIMTASKFVQDRTYSNRAWSKISGLPVKDLGKVERAFLKAIDYRLNITECEWESWTAELKRAHAAQNVAIADAGSVAGRRSSLSRSQSDNVTGAAVAHDTELRAVSPCLPSQVQPKYTTTLADVDASSNVALPYPRVGATVAPAET